MLTTSSTQLTEAKAQLLRTLIHHLVKIASRVSTRSYLASRDDLFTLACDLWGRGADVITMRYPWEVQHSNYRSQFLVRSTPSAAEL